MMMCFRIIVALVLVSVGCVNLFAQCEFTIVHSNNSDQCLVAEEEVVWKNTTGVTVSGNSITKNIVSGSWDAGGISVNTVNNNGWMSTVVSGTNTDRMIGLSSSPSTTPSFSRSQFGIYLRSDGKIAIWESGSLKSSPTGQYGDNSYITGDVFMIKVEKNVVKYYQNSTLLMISTVTPTLPLRVDATLSSWSPAAVISTVKVANPSDGTFTASASSPGTGASYQWFVDGASVGTGTSYTNTSLTSGNQLSCVLTTGTGGCVASGSTVNSNTIRFQTVSLSSFAEYNVLNASLDYACQNAKEPVVFTNLTNSTSTNNSVYKMRGSNFSFDGGAFSVNAVYNNGSLEGKVAQNNKGLLFGLSSTDNGVAFGSVQFAFYARNDGALEVYEGNSQRIGLGAYAANDILKIEVDNNKVKYYVNGSLKYSSAVTPTLPLYADVCFYELNGIVSDVFVTNGTQGSFSLRSSTIGASPSYQWKLNGANVGTSSTTYSNTSLNNGDIITCEVNTSLVGCPTTTTSNVTISTTTFKGTAYIAATSATISCAATEENVSFTDLVNVSVSSNTVEKVLGTTGFYDAGATSLNKVYNNGYAKFTATQANTDRYFGLSSNASAAIHSSSAQNTIQYAIYLAGNGTYWIYESGTYRNVNGTYSAGDIFKIRIDNNVVRYYRNSTGTDVLLYTSSVDPTGLIPLVVDISLSTRGATNAKAENVVVSNGSDGVFQAITANIGPSPIFQWKLNGANVGTGASTYTNSSLGSSDAITCFITPDISGCASLGFLSNTINVVTIGGASSPSSTWSGASSALWDNPSNWTNGVPAGYTKVVIPSGTPNSPQVNLSSAAVYDITINSGATLSVTGSNNLYVFNQWNNKGTVTANTSTLNFKTCTNNKNALISTASETLNNVVLDNANGIDVTGEHHIKNQLTLTSGIADYSSASDIIIFDDNATVTGASNTSFIRGKVKKVGNDVFTFPIGKNSSYRSLGITAPANVTDEFTAEYIKSSAVSAYSAAVETGLDRVSGCEYWTLQRSGTSTVKAELSWKSSDCLPAPYISSVPDLAVTFWDGTKWKNAGNGFTSGDANNGTITSSAVIANYTALTLGSVNSLNSLPITLIDFTASLKQSAVELKWSTSSELHAEYFVLERADETNEFIALKKISAMGGDGIQKYLTEDISPVKGRNYYRLKMVDADNTYRYSKIIMVEVKDWELNIFPNPVKQGEPAFLSLYAYQIVIKDMMMKPVMTISNSNTIETVNLPAGIYYYQIKGSTEKVGRLIVQ